MKWVGLVLCVFGCVDSSSVVCEDGTVCPSGDVCDATHHLCVRGDQLSACDGKQPTDACDAVTDGHCLDGVCLASACGDGIVELGEACDDGNTVDAKDGVLDGCAADCHSNFTCGNGKVDVLANEQCDDSNAIDHDGCSNTCQTETPHWVEHLATLPGIIQVASAYDAKRDRFVVFGGTKSIDEGPQVGETYEWDGTDWIHAETPVAPSPRVRASMAFDSDHGVSVLFGGALGVSGVGTNDTWIWNGLRWQTRYPAMTPTERVGAAMAYDPRRHKVVLFGGNDPTVKQDLADTWEWDGVTWTAVTTTTHPPARSDAAIAFDPKLGKIVLVGGNTTTVLHDTWTYDGTWTDVSTSPAPAVFGANMIWDVTNQRMLLTGGFTSNQNGSQSQWAWDGSAWTQLAAGPYAAHGGGAMGKARGAIVLFDDTSPGSGGIGETWLLGGTAWKKATVPAPAPRREFIAFSDFANARSTFFGGLGNTFTGMADTWDLTANGYVQRAIAAPPARYRSAAAWDPIHSQLVMFGGNVSGADAQDTWVLSSSGWAQRTPTTLPPGRETAVMAFDGAHVIMYGGYANGVYLNDTWSWDGTTWTQLAPATSPGKLARGVAAYDPIAKRLVMFGGNDSISNQDKTWTFDGTDWKDVTAGYRPPAFTEVTLTYNPARGHLTLIGGADIETAYEWDGKNWFVVPATNAPSGRTQHQTMVINGTGLLVYDGTIPDPTDPDNKIIEGRIELRWDATTGGEERCDGSDNDGDGTVGCADPDCWRVCAPLCPPNTTCDPAAPTCGDGICDGPRESCSNCAADCHACAAVCGDGICTTGETGCPGDCP